MAQDNAATAKASFLELPGTGLEEPQKEGHQ